jgi:sugar lactone lactonase YvrE
MTKSSLLVIALFLGVSLAKFSNIKQLAQTLTSRDRSMTPVRDSVDATDVNFWNPEDDEGGDNFGNDFDVDSTGAQWFTDDNGYSWSF